ncbi:MAG: intein-containing RctB family protein, partial [Methanobacteriota archaeon]
RDLTLEQSSNVAFLQGIYKYAITLPDGHQGYGFPIGGVAATDAETGVISPGGVGYDINCLPARSKVLTPLGYRVEIEKICPGNQVTVLNQERTKPTEVLLTMNKNERTLRRIKTSAGFELTLSLDHPVLTRGGMRESKKLLPGTEVAIHPFEGIEHEEPKAFEILVSKRFKAATVKELEKRGLLPLTSENEKLPHLLKIFGYLLGDGVAYDKNVVFYGDEVDLKDIKQDLLVLGYTGTIYERRREHEIKGYKFSRTESSLKVSARSLVEILWALGYPKGSKTKADFSIPEWLLLLPLWMKRVFLASYFGAEMSKPKTKNGYNFYMPEVKLSKERGKERGGMEFLKRLQGMLKEFGVASTISTAEETESRIVYRILVKEKPENLLRLWSKIGYEYNRKRRRLAMAAIVYLKIKQLIIQERERFRSEMRRAGVKSGVSELTEKYRGLVNRRFIERSLYDETEKARPPFGFIKFEAFLEKFSDGEIIYDRIVETAEVENNDKIYDITVENDHHNFVADCFVVSNCGVRLLRTGLDKSDVVPKLRELVDAMFRNVPSGLGSEGKVRVTPAQLDQVLEIGARWAVENGYGWKEDLDRLEERGEISGASARNVSNEAKRRGYPQLGSLGSGNHFLEIQTVDKIFDQEVAKKFGIDHEGQVTVMIHTGSRGLGHQVCSDYLRNMERAVRQYNIFLPDRELVNVPVKSPEGQAYLSGMRCAANFAWANRQMIVHWVRQSFEEVMKRDAEALGLQIVYDVAHNIAKLEEHDISGEKKKVCVHRKGATRAFPAGHPDVPSMYRDVGQPVLIPGDMGTASYVMVGTVQGMSETFGSTAHGAGRHMSRTAALKRFRGEDIKRNLEAKGMVVRAAKMSMIAEEAPDAYKDIDKVVDITHRAGIARKVVRLVPIGVAKG